MPHAPVPGIDTPFGLFALAKPVEFDAIDDAPVDVVCLLLTPAEKTSYLNVLARIARMLRSKDKLHLIRTSISRDEIYNLIIEELETE